MELRLQIRWSGTLQFQDTADKGGDPEIAVDVAREYCTLPQVEEVRVIDQSEKIYWHGPACDHDYFWKDFCPFCHEEYIRHKP